MGHGGWQTRRGRGGSSPSPAELELARVGGRVAVPAAASDSRRGVIASARTGGATLLHLGLELAYASACRWGRCRPARPVDLARVGSRLQKSPGARADGRTGSCPRPRKMNIDKLLCEFLRRGRSARLDGSRGITGAAYGPARRPAWPRADLRADLRAASRSRVRTCVRLCVAGF